MNDRLKSVIYFFATILLITSSPSKSEETIIYIEIEREDNLSVLLYSTGITPLYGRGNAVERYTNRFPLVYNQELEIGTYAPLMRDEVIFYENLQETHPQHYRLRRRLYTLNDYDQYIAQPSLKKDETPPPPVHEKKQRKKYQFSTTASLGAQGTSRSYKKNHLVTDTDSYLQGFVEIEISEENYLPHWFAKIYIQPWLGGSEGLSADYQFQIERTSFCRRVLCHLGITYKNLGFVSRASNNNRIADQFTTLSPYLKLGWSFANKVDLLAGYTPLVLGRFKHDDEKASGHLLGLEVFWNYTRRLEQQIILESFSAKSDLGHKLSGQRFGASLGWHF